jgi:hypothetical protein
LVSLVLVVSFLLAFPPITYMHSSSPPICAICLTLRLEPSNYTGQRVQVMKLLVMQFPPPPSLHPPSALIFSSAAFKADVSHSLLLPPHFPEPS